MVGTLLRSTRLPPALIFGAILFIIVVGVSVVLLGYDGDEFEPAPAEETDDGR